MRLMVIGASGFLGRHVSIGVVATAMCACPYLFTDYGATAVPGSIAKMCNARTFQRSPASTKRCAKCR